MPGQRFYITTPIYYVNDKPHIGHVYTTAIADVIARFHRFAGDDVFFLTGTDEHAAKVVDAAAQQGMTAQQWADQNAAAFQDAFGLVGVTNDDFIRTSQDRHKQRVQKYVTELLQSGDVYLGDYEGWYDAGQEEYVPESKAREYEFKSPINRKPLVKRAEKNYFFKLSGYREALLKYIEAHPEFVQPDARRNEIVARIREAEDVPISRAAAPGSAGGAGGPTGGWGIPVPGDEKHLIYVWIDALFNYLTAVDTDERRRFWPANVHLIAKDILWFHAAIWPAILMALQRRPGYEWVEQPRTVYAHSFWIAEGQKMSKTLGNFIDLPTIERYLQTYGLDALRYYLATAGPMGATDSDFVAAHFHDTYTTDLVNTVGNCASRVTAMIGKYFDGVVPADESGAVIADHDWRKMTADHVARASSAIQRLEVAEAIECGLALIRRIDGFINAAEPFKLAKDESKRDELAAILYQCAEALRIASLLLWPAMPEKIEALWAALSVSIDPGIGGMEAQARWGGLTPGGRVQKVALFPRVEQALSPVGAA